MPDVHFTNLLIVLAAGLLAPLVLGFVRSPAIVLGIVIGPSVLGWVKPDLPVSILTLVGLAFLLFLSGLEIDVQRLRGRVLKLTALGFAIRGRPWRSFKNSTARWRWCSAPMISSDYTLSAA